MLKYLGESQHPKVFESFKSLELFQVLFEEVSKLLHQAATFTRGDSYTRAVIESLAGSLDSSDQK
jgi:hypothetical protein